MITTEQAAKLLNVSAPTIRRLVYRGLLAPINPPSDALERPKLLLFHRSEVERFATRRSRRAPQPGPVVAEAPAPYHADVEHLAAHPPARKPRTPRH